MRHLIAVVLGFFLLALLGGCSRPSTTSPGPRVYVGEIAGSDALIALVVQDGQLAAYACGGPNTWGSHTGWFFGTLSGSEINPTTAPNGHRLEGRLSGSSASGSFTLPDGTSLSWTAQEARPGTGAGLYAHEEDGQRTGLIVTNEGKMAGASRLATGDSVGLYAPVTVTSPPTGGSTTVSVTFPNQDTRNIDLTLVDPLRYGIYQVSPTIIVLLHGATAFSLPQELTESGVPGTRKHVRRYWTYPTVVSLLGGDPSKNTPLQTLTGVDVTGDLFLNAALTHSSSNDIDNPPPPEFCNLADMVTAERYSPNQAAPPQLSLLLGRRDAKKGLVEQSMDATKQIYACVRAFEQRFRHKPKLVFVAHSYGGLVTRFILSNPARNALSSVINPVNRRPLIVPTDPSYDSGDLSVRVKMDYLRDHTYYAVTSSTPHEGTRMADVLDNARRLVRIWRGKIIEANEIERQLRESLQNTLALLYRVSLPDLFQHEPIIFLMDLAEDFLADKPVLTESHTALWQILNTGVLHPSRAIRTNQSPIHGARGRLIPIYTLGNRNPGSTVLDTFNLSKVLSDLDATGQLQMGSRAQRWVALTVIADHILQWQEQLIGFNRPPAGFADKLDRVERADWVAQSRTMLDTLVPSLNLFFEAEFGGTSSDLARFILRRFNATSSQPLPLYLMERYRFDLGGSVQVPVPHLGCGTFSPQLDYGPVVRAMGRHYGSLTGAASQLVNLNFTGFVSTLTGLGGDFIQLAADTSGWFAEKLKELGNLASCADPANWRLTWRSISVPAPRAVPTGQAARDDRVDFDGLVEYDSAMGFRLGTRINEFFDHTRQDFIVDNKPAPGSWYRRYTSDVEVLSHDSMRQEMGRFIWNKILSRNAGPLPSAQGDLSVHP
jgi:hypothetical protein